MGGRGTGKSTLIELLRFAFARDTGDQFSASTKAKFERLRGTFSGDAEIQVGWESVPGQVDIISLRPDTPHEMLRGEVHDVAAYLKQIPIQFYSQQQLSELTDIGGEGSLLAMVDEVSSAELQAMKGRENTLRAEIVQIFAVSDQLQELRIVEKELTQELQELNRQWQARKEVQVEAVQYQRAEMARQYFEKVRVQHVEDIESLNELAKQLSDRGVLNSEKVEAWPRADWFNSYTEEFVALRHNYAEKISALATAMQKDADKLERQQGGWDAVSEELSGITAGFLRACQERGLQHQDVARLQEIDRLRQIKQANLEELLKKIAALKPQVARLGSMLDELHALWSEQLTVRTRIAQEITQKANYSIKVLIQPMADEERFQEVWEGMAPDRRARIGRAWTQIGTAFFTDFQQHLLENKPALYSPWLHIKNVLVGELPIPQDLAGLDEDIRKHFVEQKSRWRVARLVRIEDKVNVELYRADGTFVGSTQSRALSEGQRNTAVLKLLLAQGDGPIVIDQPEDELDSNFIYHELVPLLRKVKNRRQLILTTHNANLPVNADTDLVFALDVKDGRGTPLAIGGLDQANSVNAVLNIMEGSAEAFKRRFEKYHF